MPDRVKCLHVLLAHSLAAGPGMNVLGDEVRETLEPWWRRGPCVGEVDPDVPTESVPEHDDEVPA
jgi:hypothetical protein